MADSSTAFARCLDGLASALGRSGAPLDAAARLLELASVATLRAVALDEARTAAVPESRTPRRVEVVPAERRAA